MAALLSERMSSCSLHVMQSVLAKLQDDIVPSDFANPQGIMKQMVE